MRVLNKVDNLLRDDPILRSSDRKLLLTYWATQGLHLTAHQYEIFMGCTSAESITRARRHLKIKYPANEKVDESRYAKFKEYRGGAVSWLND